MDKNHITDPLDYLYEELPPGRMAELRKHLAGCPECRAEMRAIRETVRQYRRLPRPVPPGGLAARAAMAARAAAQSDAAAAAGAAALDRIGADDAPAAPDPGARDTGRTGLEEDFERLKNEVKGELRRGWRQWFFHPAWTVAASALLVGSVAIHFSPRMRRVPPPEARESAPAEGVSRGIRERERIPAPRPRVPVDVPPGGEPVGLRQANARDDLPLPPLALMRAPAAPAATVAERAPESGTQSGPEKPAEKVRVTLAEKPAEATAETAEASVPMAAPAAAPVPAPAPSPGPGRFEETTPALEPEELAALAAAPVDGAAAAGTVLEMAEMEPPRLIDRPEGFDRGERVRTLIALAAMQIANGEIVDARKTAAMLRRYDTAAADEIGVMIAEAEKAAAAVAEPPAGPGPRASKYDAIAPAASEPVSPAEAGPRPSAPVAPEPEPVPPPPRTDVPAAPAEPPEVPFLAVEAGPVSVMPPQTDEPIMEPAIDLRQTLDPARAADLARTLARSFGEPAAPDPPPEQARVIPLRVYIQPAVPAPPQPPRERFTTDPYLRDD